MTAISRRGFLKALGASGLAITQLDGLRQAFAGGEPGSFIPTSVEVRDPVMHIINRLTFGPTDVLWQHVRGIGADAFIEEQLNPETIDDSAFEATYADQFLQLEWSTAELFAGVESDAVQRLSAQMIGNWVFRATYSQRQLYERMVHFWTDHFNIFSGNRLAAILKPADERDVIRPHALGRFRDILGASAHSPAMLLYLDNFTSRKEAPNENYARELLELHTLGVDGGYTEDDVQEVARCFTGWSIVPPRNPLGLPEDRIGTFYFNPRAHDTGEKVVLGHTIPAGGGEEDGEMVLDILARHPATARFISNKLIRRFVADDPPQALVERCANVFMESNGDIRRVMGTLLRSVEFWNAPPKFKRPFEYFISAVRPLNYDLRMRGFLAVFVDVMRNLGQIPFGRPSPDGYPDIQAYWSSNLLMRWNIAIVAAHGNINGNEYDVIGLLQDNNIPLEAEPIIDFMAQHLYGRALDDDESRIIFEHINSGNGEPQYIADALALLMAAPAYQYR
jgi:uncharacterized protein (DUF1800 family)